MDKTRSGKKLSNEDWESKSDRDARIAKMKDGRTRIAYKPEHAVDLDTGAIIAAPIHSADQGDTKTLPGTLEATEANLEAVGQAPSQEDPTELVADKGYHSRDGLKHLEDGTWKTRIAEPKPNGILRWKGDDDAKRPITTTERVSSLVSRVRRSSCVPNWSNARSPSSWIGRHASGLVTWSRQSAKNGI